VIHDTILAKSSAPGCAVRGIIRISGGGALHAVKKIIADTEFFPDGTAAAADTVIFLPQFPPFPAKIFFWQAGHSYTGDETIEIHTIGSPVLLDAVIAKILIDTKNIRLAFPGEFTLRAFLSGRMDLAQAEAVLGVIDAENKADLTAALCQLAGNVSAPLSNIRTALLETLTSLEASLDFAEDDIAGIPSEKLTQSLTESVNRIECLYRSIVHRGLPNEKPKIVLTGPPNVGKSTLFNQLLQRDAAIVSPTAGTTRDYLEAELDWQGISCVLIDTAGIAGEAVSEIDEESRSRAKTVLNQADVIIYCYENNFITSEFSARTIFFQTKTADSLCEQSLDDLRQQVSHLLRQSEGGIREMLPNTAIRCREALLSAAESLQRAMSAPDDSLIALEIRNAVNHLGLINGAVYTEDILDQIFSKFCIGK
jgi:tRNA modification GTPase